MTAKGGAGTTGPTGGTTGGGKQNSASVPSGQIAALAGASGRERASSGAAANPSQMVLRNEVAMPVKGGLSWVECFRRILRSRLDAFNYNC